jgi:hypothetical protein
VGDSLARASHSGASQAEVLASARPVERLPASMAGSVSDEALVQCGRSWRLCRSGLALRRPLVVGGTATQALKMRRLDGLLEIPALRCSLTEVDGGSFSQWHRSRATTERSRGRGRPQ